MDKRLSHPIISNCPRCDYNWKYKGMSFYAQCPRCSKTFRARKLIPNG